MYPRILQKKAVSAVASYPVVAITGPRQSGKSTLLRGTFSNCPYANLESLRDAEFARADPLGFLEQFPQGAILDEIQKAPHLLGEIQVRVDDTGKKGMYILSGSENLALSGSLAQSLAGRVQTLKLLPLSIREAKKFPLSIDSLDETLFTGFYPRIYADKLDPTEFYGAYSETYLERDVRNLLQVKDLTKFRRFLELCAARVGQLLKKESLANDVGISPSTVEQWLSILEATYVCFRLQPWHANIGKRLIKTPKLYFYDVGLASYLMGIDEPTQLARHPLKGGLFENLQLMEALKYLDNHGLQHRVYFFRDSYGNEVDLLVQKGPRLLPIEIKSAHTFHSSFLKGIRVMQTLDLELLKPVVVLGTSMQQERTDFSVSSWDGLAPLLEQRLK